MKKIFNIALFAVIGCILTSCGCLGYTLHILNDTLWQWNLYIELKDIPQPTTDYVWFSPMFNENNQIMINKAKTLDGNYVLSSNKEIYRIYGVIPPYSRGFISHKKIPGIGTIMDNFGKESNVSLADILEKIKRAPDSNYCWKMVQAGNRFGTKVDLITNRGKCQDIYILIEPRPEKKDGEVLYYHEDQFIRSNWDAVDMIVKNELNIYWRKNKENMEKKREKLKQGYIWYRGAWVK